ncbi:hypothetical protein Murmansk-203 [Murmansk poxvirus]|uniref:Uncharacterized protein n=1 Tax=Murmansk poxvirus TaxID=2025359 RepID=A0A223FMG4_9POXV|nr:hypothetical protein CKM52_gp004 [Murmansk poxvirus]YP_009408385.1 hypothetical protein CKM52_gp203 [Murmansk poxvirus]AST09199.1 hypothetical protein Murmansk-004 [Murmansk poxvirus]AST09398.1 hypothetical protein Murmansk-203 [Murmansk poxvirus]
MAQSCKMFSPCHCHGEKLYSENDVRHCLTEFILWVSHRHNNRVSAGSLYLTLISFRYRYAPDVFGDLSNVAKSIPWNDVEKSVKIIESFMKNSVKTTEEVAAIIGLCTHAAINYSNDDFKDTGFDILVVLRKILKLNDYISIMNLVRKLHRV